MGIMGDVLGGIPRTAYMGVEQLVIKDFGCILCQEKVFLLTTSVCVSMLSDTDC